MILHQRRALDPEVDAELRGYQRDIDVLPTYAEKVGAARREFKNKNKPTNQAFCEVKRALEEMTTGAARCMYCEDSLASEIEHYHPKALYPERTFDWFNYLYACGSCNRSKGDRFAVFSSETGEILDVTRRRNAPIEPPAAGAAVLLDPRHEDAPRLLRLDIVDTFFFVPLSPPGTAEYQRARYTIETLKLNERDALVAQRREYFHAYAASLEAYQSSRERGAPAEELAQRIARIQHMGHPTVWLEMRRQHGLHPRLRALFAASPEALRWDSHASATMRG